MKKSARHKKAYRKWHRILAGVIGIQLLIWVLSGVYFSWIPIETVRGSDRKATPSVETLSPNEATITPQRALEQYANLLGEEAQRLVLQKKNGVLYYAVFHDDSKHPRLLLFAHDGTPMPQLTTEQAVASARADYTGDFILESAQLLHEKPADYRGPLPVYQIRIDDARATRIYVSPVTGDVLMRRNRFWRVFDFFWMLHIMDYGEREDFNNTLIRTVSTASLGIFITGYVLMWRRKRRSQP